MCRRRGIGKTTVDALRGVAQKASLSFWDAMESLMTNPESSRAVGASEGVSRIDSTIAEGIRRRSRRIICGMCWTRPGI